MNKRQLGSDYEAKACDYLRKKGFCILETNFRNRFGEIDIIARDESDSEYPICFIEVKYRSTNDYGLPSEAVNYKKRLNIVKVAKYYMIKKKMDEWTPVRFDVVAISCEDIVLYKNAFDGMGRNF